jgi:hypothetical protein
MSVPSIPELVLSARTELYLFYGHAELMHGLTYGSQFVHVMTLPIAATYYIESDIVKF